jgi:hypothetical protein
MSRSGRPQEIGLAPESGSLVPRRQAPKRTRVPFAGTAVDCINEKGLQMQAFPKAADGIRTHDLLHGKQTL